MNPMLNTNASRWHAQRLARRITLWLLAAVPALLSACAQQAPPRVSIGALAADEDNAEFWRAAGEQSLQQFEALAPLRKSANGIILFVGDGMGVATITAARIFAGQQAGETGESYALSFEKFPHMALVKTYNVNQQTPDSAGTMSAMMTGVKTDAGLISVTGATARGSCRDALASAVPTLLEQLESRGWSTGVVSTARLTHATPAASYSHAPERNWEDDSAIPAAERAFGCRDIAAQLIDFSAGDGVDVALGGGRRHFLPADAADPEQPSRQGRRLDGRNLAEEWLRRPGAQWVWNREQFNAIDPATTGPVLGLFNYSHMQYELDRKNDPAGEPSLSEMTAKAIAILERRGKPYFLVVESGRIDHAHHATNAKRALVDAVELSRAVAVADEMTRDDETLLIVTADHSHVMTIAGYASRGNGILDLARGNDDRGEPTGAATLDESDQPYTTLGYANGRGGRVLDPAVTAGGDEIIYDEPISEQRRVDLRAMDTAGNGFHQEALVPLRGETHGGEDVVVFASGPRAYLLNGVQEQSYIYYVMRYAACGDCRTTERVAPVN